MHSPIPPEQAHPTPVPTDTEAVAAEVRAVLDELYEEGNTRAEAVHDLHLSAHELDPDPDPVDDATRHRIAVADALRRAAQALSGHADSPITWSPDDLPGDRSRTPPPPPSRASVGKPVVYPPGFDATKYVRKPLARQFRDRAPGTETTARSSPFPPTS